MILVQRQGVIVAIPSRHNINETFQRAQANQQMMLVALEGIELVVQALKKLKAQPKIKTWQLRSAGWTIDKRPHGEASMLVVRYLSDPEGTIMEAFKKNSPEVGGFYPGAPRNEHWILVERIP